MPSTERARDSPDTSLLGREIDDQFWSYMDRDYLTEEDIIYLATKYIPDKARRGEVWRWVQGVKKGEEKWRTDGEPVETDPGANDIFMVDFRETLMTWYGEMVHAKDLDPLTRAAILSTSRENAYVPYQALSPDLLLSWAQPGEDGYIIGPKGSGKTSTASLLGKAALVKNYAVVGGIPLREETTGYFFCTSGKQMLRAFCTLKKSGVFVLVLLDEGFFSYSGETPLNREVMAFRMFSRLFRKLGASLVDITQYAEDVPKELRKTAALRIKKLSRMQPDQAFIQIRGSFGRRRFDWSSRVKWIPDDTGLPYKTDDPAAFIMDFDPKALMEYLSSLPMQTDRFEATLRWLNEAGLQFHPEQRRLFGIKAYEFGQKHPEAHFTQENLAKILGVSQMTMSRWVRGERAGLEDEFLDEP